MKKSLATSLIILSTMTTPALAGGVFSTIATSGWETKPTTKYKLDMHGYDMRAYEWDLELTDQTCIMVSGETNQFLRCFPKTKK